jgi:hypothetical protein
VGPRAVQGVFEDEEHFLVSAGNRNLDCSARSLVAGSVLYQWFAVERLNKTAIQMVG